MMNNNPRHIVTGQVRLSYVNLLKPYAREGQSPDFQILLCAYSRSADGINWTPVEVIDLITDPDAERKMTGLMHELFDYQWVWIRRRKDGRSLKRMAGSLWKTPCRPSPETAWQSLCSAWMLPDIDLSCTSTTRWLSIALKTNAIWNACVKSWASRSPGRKV